MGVAWLHILENLAILQFHTICLLLFQWYLASFCYNLFEYGSSINNTSIMIQMYNTLLHYLAFSRVVKDFFPETTNSHLRARKVQWLRKVPSCSFTLIFACFPFSSLHYHGRTFLYSSRYSYIASITLFSALRAPWSDEEPLVFLIMNHLIRGNSHRAKCMCNCACAM